MRRLPPGSWRSAPCVNLQRATGTPKLRHRLSCATLPSAMKVVRFGNRSSPAIRNCRQLASSWGRVLFCGGKRLIDSYHCSRYNQNTGRLNAAMFEAVFGKATEVG